jgi:2-dehydropantoate 2-reductase
MLLAVRVDQIDTALEQTLRAGPPVPLVSLTPLLPISRRRVDEFVDGRCRPALPSVAGTLDEYGVVRYRVLPRTKTLVESENGRDPALVELVEALDNAGIPAALAPGVSRRNPATTIAFFPLSLGLSQAGSATLLVADRELLRLSLAACTESRELARRIGPVEPALALMRFAGARSLRALVAVARRFAPEALAYLERHFGHKLQAQHRAMVAEIEELAREKGVPMPAFGELAARTRR